MISYFRRVLSTLQALSRALDRGVTALERWVETRPMSHQLQERVESIERELQQWEAQVEAELLRAESKFKQARNAEERARGMKDRAEALSNADAGAEEGEGEGELDLEDLPPAYRQALLELDAEERPEEGVQPMYQGVEGRQAGREHAKNVKFGRGA